MKCLSILLLFLANLYRLSCEILSTNLSDVIQDADVRRLVQQFGKYCDGTALCLVTVAPPEFNIDDNGFEIPCCHPCRCDDDCFVTDDCCPDIIPHVLRQTELESKYNHPFRCTQVRYPLLPMNETDIPSYKMISKCSYSNTEQRLSNTMELREKCERDYDTSYMLDMDIAEIIPVSEKDTQIPYKNINCARCHSINPDNIVQWKTEVTCSKNIPLLFLNGKLALKVLHGRPDCTLFYTVPDTVMSGAVRCQYFIDRCNVTGLYSAEDAFVEQACASYTSWYKHYKNVHCYLCNGKTEQSILTNKCYLQSYSFTVWFQAVFDFGETVPAVYSKNETSETCSPTSVFDNFTNICRPVLCSAMMRLSGLRCEPYYVTAHPVIYAIRFRLVPRFVFFGADKATGLTDTLIERLATDTDIGWLKLCSYEFHFRLNVSKDKIEDFAEVQKSSVLKIDVTMKYHQDKRDKSTVATDMKNLIRLYESNFTDFGEFLVEYIADENDFDPDSAQEESEEEFVIHSPPFSGSQQVMYYADKENLATMKVFSPNMHNPCVHPIRVSYLQTCAKVVLSNESFIQRFDEVNQTSNLKVFDEVVDTSEVIFSANRDKLLICVEKFLDIVQKKLRQREGNNERPVNSVSELNKSTVQIQIMIFTVILFLITSENDV